MNRDLPEMFERALKKEISSVGPVLAQGVTPVIEKSISSAIADSLQVLLLAQAFLSTWTFTFPVAFLIAFIAERCLGQGSRPGGNESYPAKRAMFTKVGQGILVI